jgi:acyl-coenzyme A thioesterase PaaI-like protein
LEGETRPSNLKSAFSKPISSREGGNVADLLSPDEHADDAALNDRSDYQHCFVCGAKNTTGLRLKFHREGEQVVADFLPDASFEGFPGVVHGGILASLLDETLARTALLYQQWVMTGRLEIRFRRPALVGQLLRVTAEAEQRRARMVIARGKIALANEPSIVVAEGQGTFLPYPEELREQAAQRYPGLLGYF